MDESMSFAAFYEPNSKPPSDVSIGRALMVSELLESIGTRIVGARAGERFVAVLGAQQSMLESVMLKRKLMGPIWLTLACPTRVDTGAQVIYPGNAPSPASKLCHQATRCQV